MKEKEDSLKQRQASFDKQLKELRRDFYNLYNNPLNERTNVMYLDELIEKISSYNKKQNELIARYPGTMKDYKDDVVQSQLKTKLQENATAEASNIEKFIASLEASIKNAHGRKVKMKFPLKADNDTEKMLLSEAVYQRAFNWLSLVNDPALILAELNTAFNTDLNYFSSLIEIVNVKRPVLMPDQQTHDFYKTVDNFMENFSKKVGLNEVDKSIKELETVAAKAGSYLKALVAGEVNYLDLNVIKKMTPQEISKVNEVVNNSMQYQ